MNTRNLLRSAMPIRSCGMLLVILSLFAAPQLVRAQAPALDAKQGGTYYIIAFPDTVPNRLPARYPNTRVVTRASLWIYSPVTTKVRITNSGGLTTKIAVNADETKVFELGGGAVVGQYNTVIANSYTVESDLPVVLTCFYGNIQGMEAFTPLPVSAWGTEYRAAMIPGEVVADIGTPGSTEVPSTPKPAPTTVLVIAAYDGTHVTMTPPPAMRFLNNPAPTVTLNAGQVYQVASRVDTSVDADYQDDIAGTIITSDKPIAVVSGNTRAQGVVDEVGLKNNIYKNLLTEWLDPVDMHGSRFVWTPTFDEHRPGIGAPDERKREFARVYNTTSKVPMKGFYLQPGGSTHVPFTARRDSLYEAAIGTPTAIYIETEAPSQVMMHSSGIVKFNGSTPGGHGIPILDYRGWAPYMVNLVPLDRWATFAPYYAPKDVDSAGAMKHYINVVTDTASAKDVVDENGTVFPFTMRITGTPYIWGSQSVVPGVRHRLTGRNGARFSGQVYGLLEGNEHYIPSGTNPGQTTAWYWEYNALSYGYPLAAQMRLARSPDTLRIETDYSGCGELAIKVAAINSDPSGLASITIDPTTVVNAQLVAVNPQSIQDVLGKAQAEVHVVPNDPTREAHGTVIIRDRTGAVWAIPYVYTPDHVEFSPGDVMDFGALPVGTSSTMGIKITNPLTHPVIITRLRLVNLTRVFTLDTAGLQLPRTLAPGAELTVQVRFAPLDTITPYSDTVHVTLDCGASFAVVRGAGRVKAAGVEDGTDDAAVLAAVLRGGTATIDYTVARRGNIRLEIFNALGERVALLADGLSDAGTHHATWSPAAAPSGVYYCRLVAGGTSHVATIVLRR